MAKKVLALCAYSSWVGRHVVMASALFISFRLAGTAIAVAKERSASEQEIAPRPSSSKDRGPLDGLLVGKDMDEVQKLAEEAKAAREAAEKSEAGARPQARAEVKLRSLMVDFGPPRSEVFVQGRLVGNTPYAGQVACRDGDKIKVDVVPPKGLPITKIMLCPESGASVAPSPEADLRAP
ncbi:MAG: hypothetical protein B6A08_19370 [Sorangiineae bacterium NIC37A_2]|jgi:hypothetical protein|nr:MAG: hypothetical protein B6A08_19370 [Sorangiineae bacterium NIC37A_2]